MCVYTTYGFSVDKWTKPTTLQDAYKILEISPQNYHLLLDFIKNMKHAFDIVIDTDVANIIELIKTKNIFINVILLHDTIVSAYFFRKSCVFVERNMEVLTCFASINNCQNNDLFVQGFKISFWKIADDNKFGFSAIENISHNKTIIDNLIVKTPPTVKSPTAYFFYNFAHPSFKPEKVFVVT